MRMSVNKAFQFTERGPLSKTLKLVELPIPEPKDEEIVVNISAVALNPVDVQL
jgi:NADPH:quinone reductase-like Zn-dependent oxidoreductase